MNREKARGEGGHMKEGARKKAGRVREWEGGVKTSQNTFDTQSRLETRVHCCISPFNG